ncbi:MAG: protein-methionine-sulfoxide reductase heme-binding subunit MsrQ [Anaerolineaceae bacterium]|jgi:sulfoxide reductase heme-binding subunit YedZ|nr:protein-methionine-sulfoxide reductase heme-binding subunit MsrQ [Anaerolineaceae bacterium]
MVLKSKSVPLWIVHPVSLAPLLWLVIQWFANNLGANPIQATTQYTGRFAVSWLLLTLACTPLYLLGVNVARDFRRPLGLYTFMYASLHLSTFVVLDYRLQIGFILKNLRFQIFILPGLLGFLIFLALALTSNKWSIKKLKTRWKTLHRFIYLAGVSVLVHAWWAKKYDRRLILVFAIIFITLMVFRIPALQKWLREKKKQRRAARL